MPRACICDYSVLVWTERGVRMGWNFSVIRRCACRNIGVGFLEAVRGV